MRRTGGTCSVIVQLIDFEYSLIVENEYSEQMDGTEKQWVFCDCGTYGYMSPKNFGLFIQNGQICHHHEYPANHMSLGDLFHNDLFGIGMCIAAVLTERTMPKDQKHGGCDRAKCPCLGFQSWPKKGDRFDLVCDELVDRRFRTVGLAAIQNIVNAHLTVPKKFRTHTLD